MSINIRKHTREFVQKDNLIKYLETNHVDILQLDKQINFDIIAFRNGFINIKTLVFEEYKPEATLNDYGFVAKNFIDQELDPNILHMKWESIDCPIFDKMVNDQPDISDDADVKLVFYGLHGSLHYPVQEDSIHTAVCDVGASGSGKSQILNVVSATFSEEAIGTINCGEAVFGKTAFLTKEVIIDTDVPEDMIKRFGKTFFQKAVSGEKVPIPVKFKSRKNLFKLNSGC